MNEWQTMYLGSFHKPTERELFIEELAEEYHKRCDVYDDSVCTTKSERTGESIPANSDQSALINKHAFEVIEQLRDKGAKFLITREELFDAIRNRGK